MSEVFEIEKVQKTINYKFANKKLLQRAFTHSSHAYEKKLNPLQCNERLEFLGDAVLQIVSSDYLYHKFPAMHEGDLSKFRAAVVCESSLAIAARNIGIAEFLILGRGEERAGGNDRDSILADTFEAVIGAIYIDGGIDPATKFIIDCLEEHIKQISKSVTFSDHKTHLQEVLQKNTTITPRYVTVEADGPDHKKTFTVHVLFKNKLMGEGIGKSKKEAEQLAAKNALEKFQGYQGRKKK